MPTPCLSRYDIEVEVNKPKRDTKTQDGKEFFSFSVRRSRVGVSAHCIPSPYTAFPALSSPDKYLGARTAEILQPSFDRFSLSIASTGCRHGATARLDLDKIDDFEGAYAVTLRYVPAQ